MTLTLEQQLLIVASRGGVMAEDAAAEEFARVLALSPADYEAWRHEAIERTRVYLGLREQVNTP